MLNTNQSNKKNALKYAIVIPVLVAFIMLFQVRVIAKERFSNSIHENEISKTQPNQKYVIQSSSTDNELKEYSKQFKKDYKIDLNIKGIKRNADKEITAINISLNDNKGKKANHKIDGDEAIEPIYINVSKGKNDTYSFAMGINEEEEEMDINISLSDIPNIQSISEIVAMEVPELPETPVLDVDFPTPPDAPNMPDAPETPTNPNDKKAWAKFEKEMEVFEKKMKSGDWKKFEAEMKVFEEKMKSLEPKIKKFAQEMVIYDDKAKSQDNKQIQLENGDVAMIFQKDKLKIPGKPTILMSDTKNVEYYLNNVKMDNAEIEKIDADTIKTINVTKNKDGKTQVYVITK